MKNVIKFFAAAALVTTSAQAAITVNASGFGAVTDGSISTAGALDWGYLSFDDTSGTGLFDVTHDDVLFDNLVNANTPTPDNLTTVGGTSPIGEVRLTEGDGSTDVIDGRSLASPYTFDGNTAYGSIGSFAPSEQDVWTLNFNDLGVGRRVITLFLGHSDDGRNFDMDISGTGFTSFTDRVDDLTGVSNIGNLGSIDFIGGSGTGSAFIYEIDITTTVASDDVALTFGSVGGGSGEGLLSGYTIAVPEPSSFALMALGLAGLYALRRRAK